MKPIKKGERAKLARRLSKKIINILAVYNISQHDLATDIGIKPNTFSGWANGTNCPKHRDLYDQVMAYLDATYIKQDADQLDLLLSPGVDISKPTLGLTLTGEAATGITIEPPSKAAAILMAGVDHMQARATTYDNPEGERSMGKTIAMFNELTCNELTEEQGWMLMAILKMVRSQQGDYRADSYEDGSAYFALAGEAAQERVCSEET